MKSEDGRYKASDNRVGSNHANSISPTLKQVAFEYWQKGLLVVPIVFAKEADGRIRKQPLVQWSSLLEGKQALQDFEALTWDRAEGFALVGGDRTDSGLYVGAVDYDVKNVGEEAKDKGKQVLKHLPVTQIEETPSKGQHWVYWSRKQPPTIEAYLKTCGVELLGKGHLIVMAPSRGYKRLNDNSPTVVQDLESIFIDVLEKAGVFYEDTEEDKKAAPKEPYRGEDPPCIRAMLEGVEEGMRDNCAIRLACYFLNMRKNSYRTSLKKLRDWNRKNKPPLEEKVVEEKVKSAEKGGYVYGCKDGILASFCRNKAYCPLAVKSLSPLELVERELQRQKAVNLHPLIDYSSETGLTMGALLGGSSKFAIFSAEKAFIADKKELGLGKEFADNISVREVKSVFLQPVHCGQILFEVQARFKGEKNEIPSKSEVFKRVLQKGGTYWWHSDKRYLTAVACWIIGSYMFPVFEHYPILHAQGPRETGKSTLLWLLWLLAWNPTDPEAAPRPADLFRTIEGSRPTYLLDVTRLMTKGLEAGEVIDVFEHGCERGGKIRRCHPETLEPEVFEVYSPKAISTRENIPFEAKCITIITEKAPSKEYTKRRIFLKNDPDRPGLVRELIRCALYHGSEVLDAYKRLEQTERLYGRRFEFWAPLLAVCRVFAPERYDELLALAEEDALRHAPADRMSEVEEALLTVLLANIEEKSTWLLKDLTVEVQKLLPWVKDWHPIKSAIANLGILKEEYSTSTGKTTRFDRHRVKARAESRGIVLREPSAETEEPISPQTSLEEETQALSLGDVIAVEDLYPPSCGECVYCKQRKTLSKCVKYSDGDSWAPICEECAEKLPERRLGKPLLGDMVKILRGRFPQKFVEVEFYDCAFKHGWTREEAESLLETLGKEGSIFKTSEGAWTWT